MASFIDDRQLNFISFPRQWSATVLAHIRLYRLLEIGGQWMDRVCRLSKGGTIGRSAGLTVLARCSQRYVHFFTGTSKCTCLYTCSTGTHIRVTMRHRCRKSLLGPPSYFRPARTTLTLRGIVLLPFSISTIFPLIDNP